MAPSEKKYCVFHSFIFLQFLKSSDKLIKKNLYFTQLTLLINKQFTFTNCSSAFVIEVG